MSDRLRDHTPDEIAARDVALARAYRDLESDLFRLTSLTIVAESYLENTLRPTKVFGDYPDKVAFLLNNEDRDALFFIVGKIGDEVREIEAKHKATLSDADPRRAAA